MLREIAHSRAGDKGNISNLSVIVYEREHYQIVKQQVTAERVKDFFKSISFGKVTRYECDAMGALNFVLEAALDGGSTRSHRVDNLGKSLSSYLLAMEVEV